MQRREGEGPRPQNRVSEKGLSAAPSENKLIPTPQTAPILGSSRSTEGRVRTGRMRGEGVDTCGAGIPDPATPGDPDGWWILRSTGVPADKSRGCVRVGLGGSEKSARGAGTRPPLTCATCHMKHVRSSSICAPRILLSVACRNPGSLASRGLRCIRERQFSLTSACAVPIFCPAIGRWR